MCCMDHVIIHTCCMDDHIIYLLCGSSHYICAVWITALCTSVVCIPSKYDTLTRCFVNVGPASKTVGQH